MEGHREVVRGGNRLSMRFWGCLRDGKVMHMLCFCLYERVHTKV